MDIDAKSSLKAYQTEYKKKKKKKNNKTNKQKNMLEDSYTLTNWDLSQGYKGYNIYSVSPAS